MNKEQRNFKEIYDNLDLTAQFDRLMGWYEERTVQIQG
jgi:hypothetical protein